MRNIRVQINQPLETGKPVVIEAETAHYLLRVLRVTVGQKIHLFNGEGGVHVANIIDVSKRSLSVMPIEFIADDKESNLHLTLVQGISRGQKMDFTIQKSVELGVNRIVPVMTEFGNIKLEGERASGRRLHWRKIIISACEQCGRNRIPEILEPVPLEEWLNRGGSGIKLLLDAGAESNILDFDVQGELSILCGPEGGLSSHEMEVACASGYQAVRLGPRILRTETAALTAIALCQGRWGDLC